MLSNFSSIFYLLEGVTKEPLVNVAPNEIPQILFILLNTSILIIFLGMVLYNPVRKFLANREQRIADQIDNAAKLEADALKMKADYDLKLKEIEKERGKILSDARKNASNLENRMIQEAKNEASLIIKRAQQEVQLEKDKAGEAIKTQVIEISTLLASKYVAKEIDHATQNKLLNEAINDLGDVKWGN